MKLVQVASERLANQRPVGTPFASPGEVVERLGAVHAPHWAMPQPYLIPFNCR